MVYNFKFNWLLTIAFSLHLICIVGILGVLDVLYDPLDETRFVLCEHSNVIPRLIVLNSWEFVHSKFDKNCLSPANMSKINCVLLTVNVHIRKVDIMPLTDLMLNSRRSTYPDSSACRFSVEITFVTMSCFLWILLKPKWWIRNMSICLKV